MWPRLVGRGNSGMKSSKVLLTSASMWPRLVGRGNEGEPVGLTTPYLGPLQCGRGWLAAETLAADDPPHERDARLQCGRGWLAAETTPPDE